MSSQDNINDIKSSDDMVIERAIEYAKREHEKILALLYTATRTSSNTSSGSAPLNITHNPMKPSSNPTTTSTTSNSSQLAAIAQLAPAHLVGSMAIFNRIYVGSVQFDISESDLELLFSQYGPVRSISMMQDPVNKRHRGYGFIEFETPEAAALAQLQMDGVELGGRCIKVGRPNNFPADLPPGVPRPVGERIYVSNIHGGMEEAELRLVMEAFGKVKKCNLIYGASQGMTGITSNFTSPSSIMTNSHQSSANAKTHRGYAYVEYESLSCANSALALLNNFELAKKLLKVGKSIVGGAIPGGCKVADSGDSGDTNSENITTNTTTSPKILPSAVLRAAEEINNSTTTNITNTLVLSNLEDCENCKTEEEIMDLEADILEECSKFGLVTSCKISVQNSIVYAKVEFTTNEALLEAISVMDKRWFGGRQISASKDF